MIMNIFVIALTILCWIIAFIKSLLRDIIKCWLLYLLKRIHILIINPQLIARIIVTAACLSRVVIIGCRISLWTFMLVLFHKIFFESLILFAHKVKVYFKFLKS